MRLIAANIPWHCTTDDMRALFEKHGSVVDMELLMHNSSKNRGLAFVTMGSEEEALSALNNLNSTILNDRTINSGGLRIVCLWEIFASTPGVQSVEVVFHTTSPRRFAGYGFVSFSSKEEAETAICTFNGKSKEAMLSLSAAAQWEKQRERNQAKRETRHREVNMLP